MTAPVYPWAIVSRRVTPVGLAFALRDTTDGGRHLNATQGEIRIHDDVFRLERRAQKSFLIMGSPY